MLNDKLALYHELKNAAVLRLGKNAPAVADAITKAAFPETVEAADREGCISMLRSGIVASLSKEFSHKTDDDPAQTSMDFPEVIRPLVRRLKGSAHYVESLARYVNNKELFANEQWLDDARKFKRTKGNETLAEATTLDEIHAALYGHKEPPEAPEGAQ
jgi:hypothetical protein